MAENRGTPRSRCDYLEVCKGRAIREGQQAVNAAHAILANAGGRPLTLRACLMLREHVATTKYASAAAVHLQGEYERQRERDDEPLECLLEPEVVYPPKASCPLFTPDDTHPEHPDPMLVETSTPVQQIHTPRVPFLVESETNSFLLPCGHNLHAYLGRPHAYASFEATCRSVHRFYKRRTHLVGLVVLWHRNTGSFRVYKRRIKHDYDHIRFWREPSTLPNSST